MREQVWKGYNQETGHYVEGRRAFDAGGVCYIVKGEKKPEETPIYNIYRVDIGTVYRVTRRAS